MVTIKRRVKFYRLFFWKYNEEQLRTGMKPAECSREAIDVERLFSRIQALNFESRKIYDNDRLRAQYIRIGEQDAPITGFPICGRLANIRYGAFPQKITSDEEIDRLEIQDGEGIIETSHFVIFRNGVESRVEPYSGYKYILGIEYNKNAPRQSALAELIKKLGRLGGVTVDGVIPYPLTWPQFERHLDLIAQKGLKEITIKMASGLEDKLIPLDENIARAVRSAQQFAPSKQTEIHITGILKEDSTRIMSKIRRYVLGLNQEELECIEKFKLISSSIRNENPDEINIVDPFICSKEAILSLGPESKSVDCNDAWLKIKGAYTALYGDLNESARNIEEADE